MQMASWLSNEQVSRAHNLYLVLSGLSQVSLSSLSALVADFVGQTEPEILRLVSEVSAEVLFVQKTTF